jgi:hypothetical protein
VADLIKHHIPKEQHEAIYSKFKTSMEDKKNIDSKVALQHLKKHLGLNHIKEAEEGVGNPPNNYMFSPNPGKKKRTSKLSKKSAAPPTTPGDKNIGAVPSMTGSGMFSETIKLKFRKKVNKGEKEASAPPDFYRSEMGMTPSSGIGLAATAESVVSEKSFERLRKNMSALVNNVDGE